MVGFLTGQQPATSNHCHQLGRNPIGALLIAITLAIACAAERGTIGAQLGRQQDGRVFIRETPANLAAAKAGLKPGDEITLINGRDVRTLDEKAIHNVLSGEAGEPVKLTVLRGETVLRVTLQRTPPPLHGR